MARPVDLSRDVSEGCVAPAAVLTAIVEVSLDAIFTCDSAGRITSWNPAAERLFGRHATEVVDDSFEILFPEHLRRDVTAMVSSVLAGDRVTHFETEVQRPDGMPVPVTMSWCPLFDGGELPVASVVVARDITEQRVALATLAEVEKRLDEAESLAHVGSWLWDLRTGVVQWSAEFHKIHGVDPLDFRGTLEAHLELIHQEDRDAVRAAMEDSVASGRPFEREYRVLLADQETRVIRISAQSTVGSAGTPVGLHGIAKDVTEESS
jgi:PAS domain S-box-containing protein